jgi:universal stress protein A
MFTCILVPTDFSEPSEAALEYARGLAGTFGASLLVLHVFDAPVMAGAMSPEGFIAESPEVLARLFEDARSRLQRRVTAADRHHYGAKTEIVTGASADCIVNYARDRGIDLIVMGTHGRSGLAHLLVGSVAEKVVRAAPCPVMTVHRAPATRIQVPEQLQKARLQPRG